MVHKQISSSNSALPQKNATENNDKKAKVRFRPRVLCRAFLFNERAGEREVRDRGRNGDFLQHSFILPWFPSFGLSSRYEPLKDGNHFLDNELTSHFLMICASNLGIGLEALLNCLNSYTFSPLLLGEVSLCMHAGVRGRPLLVASRRHVSWILHK